MQTNFTSLTNGKTPIFLEKVKFPWSSYLGLAGWPRTSLCLCNFYSKMYDMDLLLLAANTTSFFFFVMLNHFSSICTILCISMNFGPLLNVCWFSIDMQNPRRALLFPSLGNGFSELEWRRSSPSLNFLCNVVKLTCKYWDSDLKVVLLLNRIWATNDISTWTLLRPQRVLWWDTSTFIPSDCCFFASFQILRTVQIFTEKTMQPQ